MKEGVAECDESGEEVEEKDGPKIEGGREKSRRRLMTTDEMLSLRAEDPCEWGRAF